METITISCPECDKPIKAPADAVGKKIRCKACEHLFIIKAPAKAPSPVKSAKPPKAEKPAKSASPPKPTGQEEDDDRSGYTLAQTDETLRCPQCAYVMGEGEIICLGCGFNLRTREQHRTRKVKQKTGEDKFFWLLPGVLAILGVLLLLGYCVFHYFAWPNILVDNWDALEDKLGRNGALKDEQADIPLWKGALIHPAPLVFIVVFSLFASFRMGRFAVDRLILHPEPPDIEI
jgi:hypothetical protein